MSSGDDSKVLRLRITEKTPLSALDSILSQILLAERAETLEAIAMVRINGDEPLPVPKGWDGKRPALHKAYLLMDYLSTEVMDRYLLNGDGYGLSKG